jgi:hypothetical protein
MVAGRRRKSGSEAAGDSQWVNYSATVTDF